MELKLDLHVHSERSPDGRMSLEEIVERATAAGLDGCAVCDHDRTLPAGALRSVRRAHPGFLLIPGTEISTKHGHLLGWFVTEPVEARDLEDAAAAIRAQGGMAVLAHPFERSVDAGRINAIAPLLDGVEVWNSRAERKNRLANAMAERFAAAHHLRRFGGSDSHVPREIGNGVTVVEAAAGTEAAVRQALLDGRTEVSGRRSLAVDTARSQWTRRRKSGAGPLSYCKWALFAVKCLLEDLLPF